MVLSNSRLAKAWLLPILLARTVTAIPSHPMITPAPDPKNRIVERDFDAASYVHSLITSLGSDVSSYVASGVPQFFQDFPSGSAVESSLGIHSSDLAATPTEVLNLP